MNVSSISKETLNRLADQVMEELNRRWEAEHSGPALKTEPAQNAGQAQNAGPAQKTGQQERAGVPELLHGTDRAPEKLLLLGSLPQAELQALQGRYEVVREMTGEWDVLLSAGLSVETMAYVAHGIAATPKAACMLQGLLRGRQICLLEQGMEYFRYKETAPKTVYLLYQNQEKELRRMGIRFLQHSMDLLDEETGTNTCFDMTERDEPDRRCQKPEGSEADLRHLMLLQESEVIRARGMGYRRICLNQKAKITPLALDYLKNHGLTIRRQ